MVFLPHWPKYVTVRPIDLSLEWVCKALHLLGNPHLHLPPVVHIAGANGKGSSAAYLQAVMEAAGYKVHMYTSPHLLHFNERIILGGRRIEDGELYRLMEFCRLKLEHEDLTYFEACTVAAFHAFAQHPADIVILETGMGGRLDATNVVDTPAACLITGISYDHTEYLGDTLTAIAGEKAGILKPSVPCVTTCREAEALETLKKRAKDVDAPLLTYEYDWGIEPKDGRYTMVSEHVNISFPTPALPGKHQILNAGGVAALCGLVLRSKGFAIPDSAIEYGLASAVWPGRLQYLTSGYLPGMLPSGWKVLLDGAHNAAGAAMLADYMQEHHSDQPIYLVVGQTRGRDTSSLLTPFMGLTKRVYATSVFTEPSAYTGERIASEAARIGFKAEAFEGFDEIVSHICNNPPPEGPGILLCCGSLYLLSDVLRLNKNDPL